MYKGTVGGCLVVLAWAGLAYGQVDRRISPPVGRQAAPGGAAAVKSGAPGKAMSPTELAWPLPEAGPVPMPPEGGAAAVGSGPGLLGAGPYFVSVDADFLLYFTQGERASRIAFLRGPGSLTAQPVLNNVNRVGPPVTGGRFAVGLWSLDNDPNPKSVALLPSHGAELRGFFLGERRVTFQGDVTVPGLGTSGIAGDASYSIWGLEVNARCNAYNDAPSQFFRVDLIGGFRNLNLHADLNANVRTTFAADVTGFPAFAAQAGAVVDHVSSFHVDNHFFGPQLGVGFLLISDELFNFGVDFKVAVGTNYQEQKVNQQVRSTSSAAVASPQFPATSGSFDRTTFSYVPEINFNVALPLSSCITVRAGYTFLYWGNVVRAADQINMTTAAGAAGSFGVFRERGLIVQGVNLGVQVTY